MKNMRILATTPCSSLRRSRITSFDLRVLKWILCIFFISFFLYQLRLFLRIGRIFLFLIYFYSNSNITIGGGTMVKTKPSLATFAAQPNKAAQNITSFLDRAKEIVPFDKWKETPITLKGTASLRALPASLSSPLLDELHETIRASPFHCQDKCASLLEEDDEGLYGWFTLNFLLGRIYDSNRAAVFVEIGGGSNQVTFSLNDQNTYKLSRTINISFPVMRDYPLEMYTRSYLGLGLLDARFSFLLKENSNHQEQIGKRALVSPCIPPRHAGYLSYNNVTYPVIGQRNKNFSYEYCYQKIVDFLGKKVEKIEELNKRDVYLTGLNPEMTRPMREEGDYCTIQTLAYVCKRYCSINRPASRFLCFDCTYAAAFLIHGLGLDIKKEIMVINKIEGIQISWCLGVALNMLA